MTSVQEQYPFLPYLPAQEIAEYYDMEWTPELYDAVLESPSLSSGLGSATGMYMMGPDGALIGGILGPPIWDAVVTLSQTVNGTLNWLTGYDLFPIFGNLGATWSDGTPVQRTYGPVNNNGTNSGGEALTAISTRTRAANSNEADIQPLYTRLKEKPAVVRLYYCKALDGNSSPCMAQVFYSS